ncbi:hypothetical protein TNCV_253701 [Trichonephila clavipes]|nr:hypothetical protein TNCV_253701 [Trichonephila clavipes]
MSVQRFLELEEALDSLNSLDSDKSDVEINVLQPDAIERTDEDKKGRERVNTCKIVINNIPVSLGVRTGDRFQSEMPNL